MVKTLVFGASPNPSRYSNIAIHRLVENEIETEAFGIRSGVVAGIQISDRLEGFHNVDTISLYLNPKRQQEYYQTIINMKPRRVIFNPGTENTDFQNILKENNIKVEIACTLVLLATGQY
ncbi:CoA-binding protein [Flagellimonas sp. S174]|uniref:CoA-binding protein n=1 Tax=Flagellimonas sp. S174 TaxID=3410790 RepID=UPI003BF4C116